jgi:general secretion pathway protein A
VDGGKTGGVNTDNVMYRSFYKLRAKPFSLLPDPAFLYASSKHRKALAKLRSGILNRAGTTVITGEIGSGKTTIIQYLIRELEGEVTIGLINNVHSRFDNLLEWVLQAFDIEVTDTSEVKLHRAFVNFVKDQTAQGRIALLFIDETHNMSAQVLEELRLLMNINVDYPSFQVVLVGQPELRGILERPDMRQFAQRVAVEHYLQPLGEQETRQYIQHRLHVAGGDPALFDAEACGFVYQRSRGVPRLINSLCDTALEYGYEEKKESIDGALVWEILNDSANGQLLGLAEPYYVPIEEPTIHAERELRLANVAEGLDVLRLDEHEQDERRLRAVNNAPINGDHRFAERARSDIPVSGQAPAGRPRTLDDALQTLADFLD